MSNLLYERLIHNAYSATFWEKSARYAKYDLQYGILRDHLLQNRPDPNIILISGMDQGTSDWEPGEAPNMLDLPFSTCVVEATDKTLFNLESSDLPTGHADIQAIMIVEMDDRYGFIGITDRGDYTWAVDPKQDQYKLMMTIAELICGFINSKKTVVGQTKTRFRIKHKKNGLIKIKNIIHISNKVKGEPVEKRFHNIEWSHRWKVRGHRRFIGLGKVGKNRNGEPVWKSYTWVRPHIKGPDDLDLVNKIRVVQ